MFGTKRRSQWIKKRNKSKSIRKYTDNNPGYGVSVDQLQSAQPVLVSQFTSARIWYAQLMVDHFSEYNLLYEKADCMRS